MKNARPIALADLRQPFTRAVAAALPITLLFALRQPWPATVAAGVAILAIGTVVGVWRDGRQVPGAVQGLLVALPVVALVAVAVVR